ncbi:MAG: GspE/PulE family protein [Planctomycetota bacterium]
MAKLDKKLAAILVKHGIVGPDERDDVLAAANNENKSLTHYIIDQKISTEPAIIGAISTEMNLPPVDIEKVDIDPEALALIPEDIARQYKVLPVAKIGRSLTLAVADPLDVLTQDDLNIVTGCELMPVVSTDVAIEKAIQKVYGGSAGDMEDLVGEMGLDDVLELAEDTEEDVDVGAEAEESEAEPVVKLVNLLVAEAVKGSASDIHIEPSEKKVRVRFRIDGACLEKLSPPKKMHNAVVSRIKIMANLDIAERRIPQDGKFKIGFKGRDIDFRVSILPLIHGEKVVMRVLDTAGGGRDLDGLGFEERALKDFSTAIEAANGMVLVTGPTGSGKSTTLYSAVKKIISVEDNITTVEDPVEYTMEGVNQVQVNEKAGLGFADALRSILRQDPDIVLIGEIRDHETAEIAVKAALTGHLVFSTLHTNDAPTTITRLVDMGIDNFLVASCVNLVSAQRLVRRLCAECNGTSTPTEEQMQEWGFTEEEIASKPTLREPKGCGRCGDVGYKGRLPLLETLPLDQELREIIVKGGSAVAIKQKALEQGMMTLRRVGILNAIAGNTSIDEVLSITMPDR